MQQCWSGFCFSQLQCFPEGTVMSGCTHLPGPAPCALQRPQSKSEVLVPGPSTYTQCLKSTFSSVWWSIIAQMVFCFRRERGAAPLPGSCCQCVRCREEPPASSRVEPQRGWNAWRQKKVWNYSELQPSEGHELQLSRAERWLESCHEKPGHQELTTEITFCQESYAHCLPIPAFRCKSVCFPNMSINNLPGLYRSRRKAWSSCSHSALTPNSQNSVESLLWLPIFKMMLHFFCFH